MNTETLTLYPFRLEEAKQNKGNVVTRDGRAAVYEPSTTGNYAFLINNGRNWFSEDGKWLRDDYSEENRYDLFMTTPPPEDKPAPPKPAEEVANSSIIDRLDSAYHRVSSMAADGRRMRMSVPARPDDDDDLVICGALTDAKKVIATAEQEIARLEGELRIEKSNNEAAEVEITRLMWERDEAREELRVANGIIRGGRMSVYSEYLSTGITELKRRAESAEAHLATLWGELAEAQAKRRQHKDELVELQKQLAAHTWIPTSERLPTEADADQFGRIVAEEADGGLTITRWDTHAAFGRKIVRFLPIPPLPTPPESEESRKETFEEIWERVSKNWTGTESAKWFAEQVWQASREGAKS